MSTDRRQIFAAVVFCWMIGLIAIVDHASANLLLAQVPKRGVTVEEVRRIVATAEARLSRRVDSVEKRLSTQIAGVKRTADDLERKLGFRTIVVAILSAVLSSTVLTAIINNISRGRRDRRKEKIDLSKEVSQHFHPFLYLLRELHESELAEFEARRKSRSSPQMERRKDALVKQFADVQGALNTALTHVTRIFDSPETRNAVRDFFEWYRRQKQLSEQAAAQGEEPVVADFSSGGEIYGYRDRIISALTDEIGREGQGWIARILAWIRRVRRKSSKLLAGLSIAAIVMSTSPVTLASKHWTIDPPVLVTAISRDVMAFDPRFGGATDRFVNNLMYETLMDLSSSGRLLPRLAESWRVDPTGRTVTILVRRRARFHDGSILTAQSIIANMQPGRRARYPFDQVESTRALSADTIEFRLRDIGAASFLSALARLESAIIGPNAFGPNGEIATPIGTGPFRFKSHERGQFISLPIFRDYWGVVASFNGAVLLPVPDPSARLQLLVQGDIDAAIGLEPATALGGVTLKTKPSTRTVWLQIDASQIRDRRVNRAIAHAVDRRMIITRAFIGYANPADDGMFPTEWTGKAEKLALTFDQTRAIALLREAGAVGTPLILAAPTGHREVAAEITRQLTAAGFRVSMVEVPSLPEVANLVRGKRASLWIIDMDFTYDLPLTFSQLFSKDGALNWSEYSNPAVMAKVTASRGSTNLTDQYRLLNESQKRLIQEEVVIVPLVRLRHVFATSDKVKGFDLNQIGVADFTTIKLSK